MDTAARQFAEAELGRASRELLENPDARALLLAKLAEGRSVEDAVLGVVFREVLHDRKLADEFFGYFFGDLFNTSRSLLDPGLRELMETGELVDSVVRDIWKDLERVEFRTRGQFLAFLLRRMQWKRTNSIRSAKRRKRGGDLRSAEESKLQDLPDTDSRSPLSEAEHEDDLRRIAKLSAGLASPDREMLLMRIIDGHSYAEVGQCFGLSPNAVRARIQDLMQGLRERF
jgi:RNA polymerase sigma-70 factor (ECF subfamily)